MDSTQPTYANRHLSWFLWFFAIPVVSAPEKERKGFLRVGVAKANFSVLLSRKRARRKITNARLNLFLFLTNAHIIQKNKRAESNHLSDLKTLPHELPARSIMPWFKLDPISRKKPAEPAFQKIRTLREGCWSNTARRRSVSLEDN